MPFRPRSSRSTRRCTARITTGTCWSGASAGQIYAYRAHGPYAPDDGLRFDADKVLLDPYGRAVAEPLDYRRSAAMAPGRNDATALKSVVADVDAYRLG